ncbi:hypothetical protein HDU76_001278 [Blyttiomyces sp. JEL0837]|nr:hypothetical protein HDU76_001278 [Blyttiomyces sp. JEL0837]
MVYCNYNRDSTIRNDTEFIIYLTALTISSLPLCLLLFSNNNNSNGTLQQQYLPWWHYFASIVVSHLTVTPVVLSLPSTFASPDALNALWAKGLSNGKGGEVVLMPLTLGFIVMVLVTGGFGPVVAIYGASGVILVSGMSNRLNVFMSCFCMISMVLALSVVSSWIPTRRTGVYTIEEVTCWKDITAMILCVTILHCGAANEAAVESRMVGSVGGRVGGGGRKRKVSTEVRNAVNDTEYGREKNMASLKNSSDRSSYIAYLSHELRNPLHAVIGLTDSALEDTDAFLRGGLFAGCRCQRQQSTPDITINSRKPTLKTDSTDTLISDASSSELCGVCGDCGNGGEIVVETSGGSTSEICNNDGGLSSFRAEMLSSLWDSVQSLKGYGVYMVEVVNDASSPSSLLKSCELIDPLQINRRGSGLGLAITVGVLKLLGGSIRISSKQDRGTAVCFRIPVGRVLGGVPIVDAVEGPVSTMAVSMGFRHSGGGNAVVGSMGKDGTLTDLGVGVWQNPGVGVTDFGTGRRARGRLLRGDGNANGGDGELPMRILVVDDDRVNRQIVSRMLVHLTPVGTIVDVAVDGMDAVLKCTGGEDGCGEMIEYDLILMDIHMPRMSGVEAARTLRSKGICNSPLVVMTASAGLEAVRSLKDVVGAGGSGGGDDNDGKVLLAVDAVVRKPFTRETIESVLKLFSGLFNTTNWNVEQRMPRENRQNRYVSSDGNPIVNDDHN